MACLYWRLATGYWRPARGRWKLASPSSVLASELPKQQEMKRVSAFTNHASDPNVRLTSREGLMVAFGSAVETLKNQIVPVLILGVVMAGCS